MVFFFVAMGFTGRRAAEFKERYIAAFNAMERQGHARYLAAPDANALAHSVSEARELLSDDPDALGERDLPQFERRQIPLGL